MCRWTSAQNASEPVAGGFEAEVVTSGTLAIGEEPVARRVGCLGHRPAGARSGPARGVGEHPLDVRVVVDGIVLVARAEVEDPARAAGPAAPAAENLAAREARDEDELVRRG